MQIYVSNKQNLYGLTQYSDRTLHACLNASVLCVAGWGDRLKTVLMMRTSGHLHKMGLTKR